MLNILTQKVRPIGLDIGHHSIKMLQLAISDGHLCVVGAAKADIGAVSDPAARNEAIAATIKGMLGSGGFHGRTVVSCLSNDQLRIKSVRVEDVDETKIEESLKGDLGVRLGLDQQKSAIKYIVAGSVQQGGELRNELLVLAADNDVIREHILLLEKSGLNLAGLDNVPCALFRSFERLLRRHDDKDMVNIFVDVGNAFTTVVVGRGRDISFIKQIPVGGERFNAEIAGKLGIDANAASLLRNRLDAGNAGGLDDATRQSILDAMALATEQLTKEIALCFRYFSVTFRGSRPSKAVFSGGEVYQAALIAALRSRLGLEVEIAQPLRGFENNIVCADDRRAPCSEWAVATGLALKGLNFDDGTITQYERN